MITVILDKIRALLGRKPKISAEELAAIEEAAKRERHKEGLYRQEDVK